ncbi:hypothetical protein HDU93_000444 [Gonapodya sp. JEL0774]|nr:hypothetical protein HDU93_000444 [Gonapodya sp. JEL0774]
MTVVSVALVAVVLIALTTISSKASNDDAIAQGTSDVNLLATKIQKDASVAIRNHIANYLDKISGICNTTTKFFQRGFADSNDFDRSIVFLRDQASLVGENLYTYSWYNNDTMEQLGIGPILSSYANFTYDPKAPLQYLVLYYAKNKTCQNVCPVRSTNGKLQKYYYNDTTSSAGILLDTTATEYKAWTRNWWLKNQPAGQIYFTPAYVTVFLSIVQTISYPIYNSSGQWVAGGGFSFSVYSLSSVLDSMGVSTNNTLSYLISPEGAVLGMSGLGSNATQLLIGSPPTIKSIWDFPKSQYPLLNVSAATIYQYAGRDLTSNFADAQFSVENYLFQVTSYYKANYKWILVSGAPASDYLQGTENLKSRLDNRFSQTQNYVIGAAVAIVVTMSVLSAIFTEIFIAVPLRSMIGIIAKATKFDFTAVRDGSLKKFTLITEVQETLSHFLSMLKIFASSLKQNKELSNQKRVLTTGSVLAPPTIKAVRTDAALAGP